MAGYTRQSVADIINGLEVTAPPLNAEFNQIAASHNGSTGHTHDGTTGQGPKINLQTSVIGQLPPQGGGGGGANNFVSDRNPTKDDDVTVSFDNNGDETEDGLGFSTGSLWGNSTTGRIFFCITGREGDAIWRELVQVEEENKIYPEFDATVDLGTSVYRFKDLWLSNNVSAGGDVSVGGSLNVSNDITIDGDIILNSDKPVILDPVDINSGTIDGTTIGAEEPSTAVFTTLEATSDTALVDVGVTGTLDMTDGTITNVADPVADSDAVNKEYVDTTIGEAILDSSDLAGDLFVDVAGDTMTGKLIVPEVDVTGTLDVSGTVIVNVATPVSDTDAVNKKYVTDTVDSLGSTIDLELDGIKEDITNIEGDITAIQGDITDINVELGNLDDKFDGYLPLTGGALSGNLSMDGSTNVDGDPIPSKITGLATPTSDDEAANKEYVDDAIVDAIGSSEGTAEDLYVNVDGDAMTGDLSIDADLSVTGTSTLPAIEQVDNININAGTVKWITGAGEPEGVVTAAVGSLYANTSSTGGSGTLYMKASGTGNTGWDLAGAGGPVGPGDGTNALFTETFEGDGVSNTVTLSNEPASINNTQVYISGVYQLKNTYSLANRIITFTEIPPDGRSIEVVIASSVSFEDGEFVNQSGDTMTGKLKIEDNLEVTGETDTGTLVVGDGVTIDAILDEDDMVSDSDTAVPTQQSVKKYVDEKETGGMFKGNDGTKGSGINDIFRVNAQTLTTNVTIDTDQNASCAGPLAIADTVVLTVSGNLTVV